MMQIVLKIESLISGAFPLVLLVFIGIYLTLKTRGLQFRKFGAAIRFALFSKNENTRGVSSFGATCNSLAATVGTGNIAGVAAAISIGGAGAVFWMWVSALLSMVIKAAEIVIAIFYRKRENENFVGGPMYYIKYGLAKKYSFLAVLFAVAGVFSSFTTGNITQINACVAVVSENFYIKLLAGVAIALLVGIVIVGGVQKITKFTTLLMPIMALLYIGLCLVVIIKNFNLVGNAFLSIIKGAFMPKAVTGGAVGSVFRVVLTGTQKGIFSNEAGLGTAAMAHAVAKDAKVQTQGFFGVFEVFADTLLICTLTALTILCSGVIIDYSTVASSELVARALETVFGGVSLPLLVVMLLLFGVGSVIGWAAYGMAFSKFLLGKKGEKAFVLIYPLFCVIGAVARVEFAWRTAEFFNGIMLIINLFAVFMLSHKAVKVLGE